MSESCHIIVEKFLALAGTMKNCNPDAAEAAYRELMKWPGKDKEELVFRTDERFRGEKRAFIEYNNRAIKKVIAKEPPRRILLLLPFCLQHRSCPRQVVWEIGNCRNCGKCPIGGMRELAESFGMDLRIAIRSRFAPGFVEEINPDLVMAVACEHELMIGLLRIYPALCFAVPLDRPEGPCKNTLVDLDSVEEEFRLLLKAQVDRKI